MNHKSILYLTDYFSDFNGIIFITNIFSLENLAELETDHNYKSFQKFVTIVFDSIWKPNNEYYLYDGNLLSYEALISFNYISYGLLYELSKHLQISNVEVIQLRYFLERRHSN